MTASFASVIVHGHVTLLMLICVNVIRGCDGWSFVHVQYTHIYYIPQQVVICAVPIRPHSLYSSTGGYLCMSNTHTSIMSLNRWSLVQVLYTNINHGKGLYDFL